MITLKLWFNWYSNDTTLQPKLKIFNIHITKDKLKQSIEKEAISNFLPQTAWSVVYRFKNTIHIWSIKCSIKYALRVFFSLVLFFFFNICSIYTCTWSSPNVIGVYSIDVFLKMVKIFRAKYLKITFLFYTK